MKRGPKIIVWHAADGWRWHLRAANGRLVAESGEAYGSKRAARRAIVSAERAFYESTLVVEP